MLRILKKFFNYISCKKKNEVNYESIERPKDISTSDPVKIPAVKSYDYNYNYGTRYYN